jgi:hypothetical protein
MSLESGPILVQFLIYASWSISSSHNSNGNPASFSIALILALVVLTFCSLSPIWCDDASIITSDLVPDLHSRIA